MSVAILVRPAFFNDDIPFARPMNSTARKLDQTSTKPIADIAEIAELEGLAELRRRQEVNEILARISAPIDEPRRDNPKRDAGPASGRAAYRAAASTIEAFWYVVSLRDQERFKAWLADHPQDAPFLLKLLEGK